MAGEGVPVEKVIPAHILAKVNCYRKVREF